MLARLRERLSEVMDVVSSREAKAKVRMKEQYDNHAKTREFELGILVLVRTQIYVASCQIRIWDGPYEVIRKISYEASSPVSEIKNPS